MSKTALGVAEGTISIRFKEEIVDDGKSNLYLKVTPDIKIGRFKMKSFNRAAFEQSMVQFLKRNPKTSVKSTMKVSL